MNYIMTLLRVIVVLLIFLLGIHFLSMNNIVERFENRNITNLQNRCPNILIQKGSEFYLYNSRLAKVPGVNPLKFNNLEEYTEFIQWQRSQGIRCPVLYLQESYDSQGNAVYKARPSPTNLQGGLPDLMVGDEHPPQTMLFDAGRDDPPYNMNNYPGFDPLNQYVGLDTPLDRMFSESGTKVSPNPMDDSWGGQAYTQALVDAGYYKDEEVSIYVP
jgi:hypothetical protein